MNRHTRRSLQHRAGQGDSNAVPSPRTPTPRLSHKKVDGCRSLQHDRDKPSVASLRRRSASLGIVIAINSELLIGFAGIRTSTSVIERVLHNAEVCQTEFRVDRIRKMLPLFVQNDAFPRAMRLLDDTRIAIISGVPGIGKTTLAEMLLYSHLEQGFEPVVIRSDIAEGQKFHRQEAKRIFYYDDFLGQIFLQDRPEYLGRNQDAALLDFMEMVQQSASSRFILTTREHILRAALRLSERFSQNTTVAQRCILELGDYSFAHKARILYNHLYFSSLKRAYKRALLVRDYFLDIIKHPHFNPRLIEWLSTEARTRDVPAATYRSYVAKLLESPHEIWSHAFRNQISDASRHVLLVLYPLGESVDVNDLEAAFASFHRHSSAKYNMTIAPGDFRTALQEMEGAFLTFGGGRVSYLNPSIREFIAALILWDPEIAGDLLATAIRFRQVTNLWNLYKPEPDNRFRTSLMENAEPLGRALERVLEGPYLRWTRTSEGQVGTYVDLGFESRVGFLVELTALLNSSRLAALAVRAAERLIASWHHTIPDFPAIISLLQKIGDSSWVMHHVPNLYRKLLDELLGHLSFARANDWIEILGMSEQTTEWTEAETRKVKTEFDEYLRRGAFHERSDCSTLDEMDGLIDSLKELGRRFGADFSYDIDRLKEDMAEHEESREPLQEGAGPPERPRGVALDSVDDDTVKQMFRALLD